jgi:hypothetical protein
LITNSVGAGPSGNSISGFCPDVEVTGLTVVVQTGPMVNDQDILAQVNNLVAEEKELREKLQHREIDESDEHQRLRAVEVQLDQCWDLLRQRRALRETGGDPREARVRPPDEVEGYLN